MSTTMAVDLEALWEKRKFYHDIAYHYLMLAMTARQVCEIDKIPNTGRVYRILHRAAIEGCVSKHIVPEMEKHARSNSVEKVGKDKAGVPLSYKSDLIKRKGFCFTRSVRVAIITDFALSPLTRAEYCKMRFIANDIFKNILEKVIVDNELPENILNILEKKAVSTSSTPDEARRYFEILRIFREPNKIKK